LAEVEHHIHRHSAGLYLYDWIFKQKAYHSTPLEKLQLVEAARRIFIRCINNLFDLRKENKMGADDSIRKMSVTISATMNVNADELTDLEWARKAEEVTWFNDHKMSELLSRTSR
jgi:hypothetical protein